MQSAFTVTLFGYYRRCGSLRQDMFCKGNGQLVAPWNRAGCRATDFTFGRPFSLRNEDLRGIASHHA